MKPYKSKYIKVERYSLTKKTLQIFQVLNFHQWELQSTWECFDTVDSVPKLRLTHNPYLLRSLSEEYINSRADKEILEPIMFGNFLL